MRSPMSVPGPTRVNCAFSSAVSMAATSFGVAYSIAGDGRTIPRTEAAPRKKDKAMATQAIEPRMELEQHLHMYRQMAKIRAFEEQVNELYKGAKMPGLAHLYIGEEGVAVGVCEALRRDDFITSTHRGHGHCLAKGASVNRMFAELLGKEPGYCRGKGGSMHIADPDTGNLGANAIVG